ncbi:hypothetical protein [Arcobacter porcinus]|uniref:hypothetical protein n=2 Tax=Arcobacter porcinus TaxID=1935204 RepID=UPI00211D73D9|nr:hypothetical protein [Arcobacter porcinus]
MKDAEFIGIDTSNLTTYEKEIKYKDKILASDLKTREEFIVREVGIEIRASDLLTKKEFVVEEIEKTSIVENIDLVNLNLKDIQFKESDFIKSYKEGEKAKLISKSIEDFFIAIEEQKENISSKDFIKIENRLLKIKERLEKEYPSFSINDAKYLGIETSILPKLEKFEIKKDDGNIFIIENIDLEKLDISKISKNLDINYKQEILNLSSMDIADFKKNEVFDTYLLASQKAIENKDLDSFDILQNMYQVDISSSIKAYGEILNISPKEININLWEKLGEDRTNYDNKSLKLILEFNEQDYKKEFTNLYIDTLRSEYNLQKATPETEQELEEYFKSLNSFEKICEEFKTNFNESLEKQENLDNIKNMLDNGDFIKANEMLNSLDEFDKLNLKSYYESSINYFTHNFDELDYIKNRIEFEAEIRDKEYIVANELGEDFLYEDKEKTNIETVNFEYNFEKIDFKKKEDIESVQNRDFNKTITINKNVEYINKKINEKEGTASIQEQKELMKMRDFINKTNPQLSVNDAKRLNIDINKFHINSKNIEYKNFNFNQNQEMLNEFKTFANDFPTLAKSIINKAIDKQEIQFEELTKIGIKPTQLRNLTKDDLKNEKADLSKNKELLKEFQKLEEYFPELAKKELENSFIKGYITIGKLSKYGMSPENFMNYNEEQIENKSIKMDFIDLENSNIYKKDFILKIDYENKNKEIIQSLNMSSFKNNIKEPTIIESIGLKDITKIEDINFKDSIKSPLEEIKNVNLKTFQTVPNDFFKNKDLKRIDKNDLNIHNLKHLKALENSDIGFFTIKSTSSKLLESQAGLTNLINQATSIEKAIEDVDKSKVSIFQKIDHKDKLKILKKDFVKNVAKLIKNAEIILDNSLLIQKSKDDDFKNKYINEGLQNFTNNPKKLDDAFVKECKKQNNFEISYSDFKIDFLKNELKEDKKSLNSTLENYKYTLEKSLKTINKELGIMEKARSSLVIKEQLKKIDKVLSRGIEL